MDPKLIIVFLAVINYSYCAGALRRTPKVYNALITTDENLTPSRAFPVIQPTIHETGIATYPFGPYNPYRFYNPSLVRVPQQIPPNFIQGEPQFPFQIPHQQFPHQQIPQQQQPHHLLPPQNIPPSGPAEIPPQPNEIPPSAPAANGPPSEQPAILEGPQNPEQVPVMPNERPPIPLNEYGLPPSLIPLQSYQPRPQNLQPYPINNYPLIYDSFNGFQEHYLPPYEYFPGHTFGIRAPPKKYAPNVNRQPQQPQPQAPPQPQPIASSQEPTEPVPDKEQNASPVVQQQSPPPQQQQQVLNLDQIKNGNKNPAVPDVPPPPIPSGGKSSSSPSRA